MATGIEIAGLVLGVFPIVIDCLGYYIGCARRVKEISRHKDVLRQFMRDIKTEMTIFEDTLWQLTGCHPSQVKAGKFPASQLSTHLRPDAIDSIETVCGGMKYALEELQKKFQKYERKEAGYRKMLQVTFSLSDEYRAGQLELIRRYNVQFRELVTGAQSAVLANSKPTKLVKIAKSYHKVRQNAIVLHNVLREKLLSETCSCQGPHSVGLQLQLRVSDAPKEKTEGLDSGSLHRFTFVVPMPADSGVSEEALPWRELEIENVEPVSDASPESLQFPSVEKRGAESNVTILVEGAACMAESMGTSLLHNTPATPKQQKVRPKRGLTESAMKQFSKVKCWVSDNLKSARPTKPRSTGPMPRALDMPPSNVTSGPRKVAFSLPHETQQSMVTGCRMRKACPSTDIILCLCTAIRNARALHECLGVLVSTDNTKHRLWIPERSECAHSSHSATIVTLAEILRLPPPSIKERLKLGVKLASSVLQLHETQWLGERWSKQDIKFITPAETRTLTSPMIAAPFIHQNFVLQNTPSLENSIEASIVACNPSLYSLGIVLIELWHWKDLKCLQGSVSTDSGQDAEREHLAAFHLAKELYDEAGEKYGEAVRRCIQGLDTRETSLEKEEFKNKVYSEIVQPLEDNLEIFSGKSIADIFDISKG